MLEAIGRHDRGRLADVLARINDHKITDLAALLPWRWSADQQARNRAARPAIPRHLNLRSSAEV
jgi:hypothetical protein